jgi:hypothetical protein
MKKLIIILIAITTLAFLASCNDVGTNPDKELTGQSSSGVSSNANNFGQNSSSSKTYDPLDPSTWNQSSSSQAKFDTLLLSDIGTPRVKVIYDNGKGAVPSPVSTATLKVISDSSIRIDYDAKDEVSWLGGNTMIQIEYSISSEIDFHNIIGMYVKSVYADSVRNIGYDTTFIHMSDYVDGQWVSIIDTMIHSKVETLLPSFYGFIYKSNVGGYFDSRRGGARPSPFRDSNGDGWIYNLSSDFDPSVIVYEYCVDGLCGVGFCSETDCGIAKLSFYFWTPQGKGSMTINGLSLMTK